MERDAATGRDLAEAAADRCSCSHYWMSCIGLQLNTQELLLFTLTSYFQRLAEVRKSSKESRPWFLRPSHKAVERQIRHAEKKYNLHLHREREERKALLQVGHWGIRNEEKGDRLSEYRDVKLSI
jgi:hypothetical protein